MSSVRDIMIIAAMLFAVGLSLIMVVHVAHIFNANMLNLSIVNDSIEASTVINKADTAINMTDYIYLALFLGFFISIIMFGWFVGGTPIMAPIYFFIVVFFVFGSIILQLVWIDIVLTPQIVSDVADFPITNFILSHLAYFMAIFGLVGILVMFAKPQGFGGV